jgi:hypothetical protein
MVFGNRELGGIFLRKRERGTGDCRKLRIEEPHISYSVSNIKMTK